MTSLPGVEWCSAWMTGSGSVSRSLNTITRLLLRIMRRR